MKKSLLLIAPGFDSEITIFLSSNLNVLKSCTVISPNYRSYRTTLVEDVKALLGESSICKKVVMTRDHTTFTGYESNVELVNSRVENLREILKENSLSEIEMDFHKKRLANFTASIATIYIGGFSEVERGERYDRFEDAILATRAAIKSGLLPGGGVALYEASSITGLKFLPKVLKTPYFLLNSSDYRDASIKIWEGKNLKTGEIGDLYDMGIVEPYLVVLSALENAVSMGGSILTCECAILNNVIYE
jgi:chaperonin GroEL